MATINDRIEEVRFLLGNRTDIDSRIFEWYKDAFLELGMSIPFTELEKTQEDIFNIGFGEYDYPSTARSIKSLVGFSSAGRPYPIKKKDIRIIDRYQTERNGRPSIWAPYGSQIVIRPLPSTANTFRWRFWQKPQIDITIQNTELTVPDDWITVLDHVAALLGNIALGQEDRANSLRVLLHGDPKHPDENPGWIKQKLLRDAAENVVSDFGVDPKVRARIFV